MGDESLVFFLYLFLLLACCLKFYVSPEKGTKKARINQARDMIGPTDQMEENSRETVET